MKILLLCDDLWHPGETVQYGLGWLTEEGNTVHAVMDAKDIVTPELLREHDVTVIAKGNALNGANHQAPWFEEGVTYVGPEGYRSYVEEGGAVLVLHAGATFQPEECAAMTEFIGVRFVTHPRQCPVEFHVKDAGHPIMEGVSDFTLPQDEHYEIEVRSDRLEIFAETSSAAGRFPAGLCRELGSGRICVLTPGHNAFVLSHPAYRKVIGNALRWLTER